MIHHCRSNKFHNNIDIGGIQMKNRHSFYYEGNSFFHLGRSLFSNVFAKLTRAVALCQQGGAG